MLCAAGVRLRGCLPTDTNAELIEIVFCGFKIDWYPSSKPLIGAYRILACALNDKISDREEEQRYSNHDVPFIHHVPNSKILGIRTNEGLPVDAVS